LQLWLEEVPSTQDRARAELDRLPVAVITSRQTAGRGRSGAAWLTAPRALAVSVAFRSDDDSRPFSSMAGVAAGRSIEGSTLKWPNDIMLGELKVGGILVERSSEVVVGLGLNLWWPEPPPGVGSMRDDDPGPELHKTIGGLWVAEMMALVEEGGWPRDEYRSRCVTLGREITWEPAGRGRAVDVGDEGELVVEVEGRRETITSGAIRHVRG
jgi:BirA family biotin operon repressor/biotin-[acetyl-CoA-carboxylase] ligase